MTVWGKKREYNVDVSEMSYAVVTIRRIDREEMIAFVEEKLTEGWQLNGDSYVEDALDSTGTQRILHCQGLKRRKQALWV